MLKTITFDYDDENIVRIVNQKQAHGYMTHGVYPLFCEVGYNDKIVFIFDKVATEPLFDLWKQYKL